MKFLMVFMLASFSSSLLAQTCYVDMVNRYNQVVRTFTAYGDCYEALKECRKTVRLQPQLGGVDCIKSTDSAPSPWPNPYPNPNPQPQIPAEVLRMNELEQAANFALEDCYVLPQVAGWANQLYVRGQFSGNYQSGSQDFELRRAIRNLQLSGSCLLKDVQELQIQFNPYLIQDFANSQYRNCLVKLNVAGQFNQLYVRGQFQGNFNRDTELPKLRAALARSVLNGSCQYDPM